MSNFDILNRASIYISAIHNMMKLPSGWDIFQNDPLKPTIFKELVKLYLSPLHDCHTIWNRVA
jgi:hypothetical protein